MNWTKEKPTEPGWYWLGIVDKHGVIHNVGTGRVFVADANRNRASIRKGDLCVLTRHAQRMDSFSDRYRWAGPIPEPVEVDE